MRFSLDRVPEQDRFLAGPAGSPEPSHRATTREPRTSFAHLTISAAAVLASIDQRGLTARTPDPGGPFVNLISAVESGRHSPVKNNRLAPFAAPMLAPPNEDAVALKYISGLCSETWRTPVTVSRPATNTAL